MIETVFNLFLFMDADFIHELGAVSHSADGTDKQKLAFLQSNVNADYKNAVRFPIPGRYSVLDKQEQLHAFALRYSLFRKLQSVGRQYEVFEEVFDALRAGQAPLSCITPVVNGQIRIDGLFEFSPGNTDPSTPARRWIHYPVPDYLTEYLIEGGIDLARLLSDDGFAAVKILYGQGHFVSAAKLLVSFIDMVAFLEFGDSAANFQKWLDTYAQLSSVGVSSSEMWEFRNSLLHMTNLDSRRVLAGTVRRLIFYVGKIPQGIPAEDDEAKYFSLHEMLMETTKALERWGDSFNVDPSKFETFVDRYDRIVSDARFARFAVR